MKIGVTGVTGHVGSNLYPLLIAKGFDVRCLVRESNPERPFPEEFVGDVTNEWEVDEFVQGLDMVIHLAAKISISGDADGSVWAVNAEGTKNVAHSCLKHGVKRLVHFSTIHAYDPFPLDEPLDEQRPLVVNGSAYDRAKLEGELAVMKCVAEGLDAVILTPTSIFGPNDYFPSLLGQAIVDIHNGNIPALVPGGYDFVDVRDVARGTLQAMENGVCGEKYLLSGTWLTVKELAAKVGVAGNRKVIQKTLSPGLLRFLLPFFKLQSIITRKPPVFTKESLKALIESNRFISSDKAARDFNYMKTDIDTSVTDTLNWFREKGRLQA